MEGDKPSISVNSKNYYFFLAIWSAMIIAL